MQRGIIFVAYNETLYPGMRFQYCCRVVKPGRCGCQPHTTYKCLILNNPTNSSPWHTSEYRMASPLAYPVGLVLTAAIVSSVVQSCQLTLNGWAYANSFHPTVITCFGKTLQLACLDHVSIDFNDGKMNDFTSCARPLLTDCIDCCCSWCG